MALVPRHTKHIHHDNHDYVAGESELTGGLLARSSAVIVIQNTIKTRFDVWLAASQPFTSE